MSSANVETPSKITDFFPPSPTGGDGKQHSKDVNSPADDTKDTSHLSNSSVLLTPESSPAKEEVATIVSDVVQKNTETTPKCKKALSEELKPDTDPPEKTGSSATTSEPTKAASTPQPAQPKRRGRRKKGETIQLVSNGPVKPRSARKKKPEPEQKNRLVTDYFVVRRSDRKTKTQIQKEQDEDLEYKLLNGIEDGLEVQEIANKGRGVVAMKSFKRGDFVVEYAGDLISVKEARRRDKDYSENPEMGCYMYYFNFKNKSYCIDATAESGKLGRLLNHSKTSGNCHTKLVDVKNKPYLILVASRDIKVGEELEYDYGDRSKSSLESHPWLKS